MVNILILKLSSIMPSLLFSVLFQASFQSAHTGVPLSESYL